MARVRGPRSSLQLTAATFAMLILLLAIASLSIEGPNTSSLQATGAAGSIDRVSHLGQGYGASCASMGQTGQGLVDCCSMLCKPYHESDTYTPCVLSCQQEGGTETFEIGEPVTHIGAFQRN